MDQYKDLNQQCKKSARQDKQNWPNPKLYKVEGYLAMPDYRCLCTL